MELTKQVGLKEEEKIFCLVDTAGMGQVPERYPENPKRKRG